MIFFDRKNIYTKLFYFVLLFLPWQHVGGSVEQGPKLTVVLVVDQLAYHYFLKLRSNFKLGFKKLLQEGVVYTKALHPHSTPETTTGHLGLSTGCYPKDHGGVTNQWIDQTGKKIRFEEDTAPTAMVIPNNQQKSIGKSPCHVMVDNLSDQFLQYTTPQSSTSVFALSTKAHPVVAVAGKMGKAIWFDEERGIFVSSKKYFDVLPSWVTEFNKKKMCTYADYTWVPYYRLTGKEYNYPYIRNYSFAGSVESFINKSAKTIKNIKYPFSFLIKTPIMNTIVLDLAKTCINHHLDTQTNNRMLLWVSLSQLDLLTHLFGPDSLEAIDTIYHLDKQINDFITFLHRNVGASNCLFVLTADHGVAPIPEIQKLKGFTAARRIIAKTLIKAMNKKIKKEFGVSEIVKAFEPSSFYLDDERFDELDKHKQTAILIRLRNFLKKYPGIKNAWTYQELATKNVYNDQFASRYKTQLFAGRIGHLICQPSPYCQVTHYSTGTSHCTPYDYDIHVPLIFYQPGKLNHKTIRQKVLMPQLPVTLAHLLHITKPSASLFDILPGI